MSLPPKVRTETKAYVRELAQVPRQTLLAQCGAAAVEKSLDAATTIERALAAPEVVRRIFDGLPKPSANLLLRWILRGSHAVKSNWSSQRQEKTEHFDEMQLRDAAAPLEQKGLIVDLSGHVVVLPPLAAALRFSATEYAMTVLRAGPEAPPYPFFLALVAAVYAHEQPVVTQGGTLHARSEQKLEKRLGGDMVFGRSVGGAEIVLRRLGVLRTRSRGNTSSLAIDPVRAAAVLAHDAEALGLAMVALSEMSDRHFRALAQLRAASSAGGATLDEIERVETKPIRVGWGDESGPLDGWELAAHLDALRTTGFVDVVPGGPPSRLRAATPAPHGTARFVVQPSFDVLVPWDAPPARVALLGCFADLDRPDRVCRFRLTPESVARGVATYADPRQVLSILEEGASGPLPQNVRSTIEGWIGRGRAMRPVRGDVMVAADDEQRAFLRAIEDVVAVTDDVFLIPEADVARVEAAAKKRGFLVAPRVGADREERWRRTDASEVEDVVEGAREHLGAIEAEIESARCPAKSKAARPGGVGAAGAQARSPRRRPDSESLISDEIAGEIAEVMEAVFGERPRIVLDEDDDRAPADLRREPRARGERKLTSAPSATPIASTGEPGDKPAPTPEAEGDDDGLGPWESPLPGVLRSILVAAIRSQATVSLLYSNRKHESVEHLVVPKGIRTAAGREELLARDESTHSDCVLPIDRITAIRRRM